MITASTWGSLSTRSSRLVTPRGRIAALELRQAFAIEVADPADLNIGVIGEYAQKVGSPIAEPNYRDPHGTHWASGWIDQAAGSLCRTTRCSYRATGSVR